MHHFDAEAGLFRISKKSERLSEEYSFSRM
jgi:hypothetical protein